MSHLAAAGASTAGDLAAAMGIPANTMSSHLAILSHAGLVTSSRNGRNIVYAACAQRVADLAGMLTLLANVG